VPAKPQWWDGGDLAATITTKSDDQRMPDKANAQLVMQPVSYDMKQHHNPQPSDTAQLTTKNCAFVRGDTPLVQPIPIHDQATRHVGKNGEKTMGKGNGLGVGHPGEPMNTLTKGDRHAVAHAFKVRGGCEGGGKGYLGSDDLAFTISTMQDQHIKQAMAVRRLTPVECERLQGFGDNYTDIKSKNKPTPDGPRYKALGNSMAVPVMAWIGQRIEQVEAICKQSK
jgi:site-specific DNA-cytosine methylase